MNGASVVECTSETLIKEYLLGTRGLAERSSYKVTDVAKALTQQRISVRGIKLLMNNWLENEAHRFVRGAGCSCKIRGHREDVKASNVFGLYDRERFLESCLPPSSGVADYLLALLLVDALLVKEPETAAAEEVAKVDTVSVPTTPSAVTRDSHKKRKAAEKRRKYSERQKAKKAATREAEQIAEALLSPTDDIPVIPPASNPGGKPVLDTFVGGLAVAAELVGDGVQVQDDHSAFLPAAAALPRQGNFSLSSSGLALDSVGLFDQAPSSGSSLASPSPAVTSSGGITPPPKRRFTPPPSPAKTPPPKSPVKTPTTPPSELWNIDWGSGVKTEYFCILSRTEHKSHLARFDALQGVIRTEGMAGLKKLGVQKMESQDNVFSYRLNDYLRAVFAVDSDTKTITFIKGIEHYGKKF